MNDIGYDVVANSTTTSADRFGGVVDHSHPWLGLASFSEDTQAFFFGREEEVGELARRVQRKLLTILFGQSGLGKTSILRAGIVPRLRAQGYCPVYVRIDYGAGAPPAARQIKDAVVRETAEAGTWTRAGVAETDESLWEFFHHRDDVLLDHGGQPLTPLLIFDQFEEIFTLAQSDDDGRRRAADFLEGLAELVENRPSKALEARLEEDDSAVERFDFARNDYRVLITLREDYLAHLESLKGSMPSITQNRMRLAPMTGQQALSAVIKPGGRLVSEEVAQAIVRFVAGGAELAHAQVEPSLLSLICRELNDKRVAAGRDDISLDLLAGSHAAILSDFYERALADQPDAVRAVVEDLLLTESGYRENVAEERVRGALSTAGAAPETLARLVDRRLLRIEDRLDVRRVELTHDVLCVVVSASRARRLEREREVASARLLAAQRERERATRRTLIRTRQAAIACAVLALGAVAALVYAVSVGKQAELARGQAENLIGYLSDDFARELKGSGRQVIVGELGRRTVAYYNGLPSIAPGSDTERNRALAMISQGIAMRFLNKIDEASRILAEADQVLAKRIEKGDHTESTVIGHSRALYGKGMVSLSKGEFAEADRLLIASSQIAAPFATAPGASEIARRTYGDALNYVTFVESARLQSKDEEALAASEAAMHAFASLGALDVRDVSATLGYADAANFGSWPLRRLGRQDEATRQLEVASTLVSKVLEAQPIHFGALESRADIVNSLAIQNLDRLQAGRAYEIHKQTLSDLTKLSQFNPSSANVWWNLAFQQANASNFALEAGYPREALLHAEMAVKASRTPERSSPVLLEVEFESTAAMARLLADMGDLVGAKAKLQQLKALSATGEQANRDNLSVRVFTTAAEVALLEGEFADAAGIATQAITLIEKKQLPSSDDRGSWRHARQRALVQFAEAKLGQREYAAAERSVRAALATPNGWFVDRQLPEAADQANMAAILALALVHQGRAEEAKGEIAPAVALQSELNMRNTDDQSLRVQYSGILYAQALVDPAARRTALLKATTVIAALPKEMRTLLSVTRLKGKIDQALSGN